MASKSPFAKNAKTILTRSLEDIEAGSWKRGTWGNGKSNGKCEITMGCMNGLISMHGGHITDKYTHTVDGKKYTFFNPCPASTPAYDAKQRSYTEASPGVKKATAAVFAALPRKYQALGNEQIENGYADLTAQVDAIIAWNDDNTTTKGKAAKVCRKAIDLLPTLK